MHDTKLSILAQYLSRGWALVPLHDVSAGICSCGRGCDGSAGKHPRYARWQQPDQLVRDERTLASLLASGGERWNWGVATGPISGIWVLDVDPAAGGEVAYDALLRELGEAGETLPGTLTLGPTGGGGRHLVYAWPTGVDARGQALVIHGSQTKNRYGLLPGLDVRGQGGQIVVAPSVSGKGAYGGVLIDLPVASVGPVLLDRLAGGAAVTPADPRMSAPNGGPPLPGGPDAGVPANGGMTAARYAAYAAAAVRASLDELRTAPVGTRNDTAFRVACRLIELVNAPWSGVELDAAWRWWRDAAGLHPDGVAVPDGELDSVWRNAVARVGGSMASPPRDDAAWTALGGEVIPFSATSPAVGSANGGAPESGGDARGIVEGSATAPAADDPVQALIDRMLTPEQLREVPAPEPLISGVLDLDTCTWLIGPPGSYKSFVAIDLAAHVGRGEAWRGRPVKQGLVVMMVGEGARGTRLRTDAWEREYGPLQDIRMLPFPVQAEERRTPANLAGGWTVLVEAVRRLRPVFVVIETQARVTLGLNENDNSEMSYFAAQVDRLRAASGACVLVVHHTGRAGTNARGASAIDGAQDAELRMEKTGNLFARLHMDKQKDQAEEPPMVIALRRSEGGTDPKTGRDLSSLVLTREVEDPFMDPGQPVNKAQERAIALYKLIYEGGNFGEGMTRAEIRKAFIALPMIASLSVDGRDKAWRRAWNGDSSFSGLIARGLIMKRAGTERFKVIVVRDQSAEGCLTVNPTDGTGDLPPAGWNLHTPDDEHR